MQEICILKKNYSSIENVNNNGNIGVSLIFGGNLNVWIGVENPIKMKAC